MTSSDAPFEIAMARAAHYAGLRGAKPAECEYVHRFNGYIQGFLEGKGAKYEEEQLEKIKGAKYEEEQLEKIKAKECDHVSAVINWNGDKPPVKEITPLPEVKWSAPQEDAPKINSALAAFL